MLEKVKQAYAWPDPTRRCDCDEKSLSDTARYFYPTEEEPPGMPSLPPPVHTTAGPGQGGRGSRAAGVETQTRSQHDSTKLVSCETA